MAPHSSTLAWKIPWMEEPDGLQSMGTNYHNRGSKINYISNHTMGEGNGTPLQYSCLENPMDGEAW